MGHTVAPAVVELVFVEGLPESERASILADAADVASLSSGARVAILPREAESNRPLRLETPPELAAAWEEMRQSLSYSHREDNSPPTKQGAVRLWERVGRAVANARRGPVVVAAVVGLIAVILALTIIPGQQTKTVGAGIDEEARPQSIGVSTTGSEAKGADAGTTTVTLPNVAMTPTQAVSGNSQQGTLAPESVVGDIALVALPSATGAIDSASGPQYAVLERDGATWRLREVYGNDVVD